MHNYGIAQMNPIDLTENKWPEAYMNENDKI